MPQTEAQRAFNARRTASRRARAAQKIGEAWEPEWSPVQLAAPVKVAVPKRTGPALVGQWKTALTIPDNQFGFRWVDGKLDPFHDPRALNIALQVAEAERPDVTINQGDHLDFPMFGTYRKEPAFADTAQATLDAAHEFDAQIAAVSGRYLVLEGNHDLRLQNYLLDNAAAAYGLHPANMPDSWPALSVPSLLRFNELGIEYVDGYPVGAFYLMDNLAFIHGRLASSGDTAQKVLDNEQVTTVFGHTHHKVLRFKTRNKANGHRTIAAYSAGCTCRIDGAVPGAVAGLKRGPYDKPAKHWQDWQQGVGVIRYNESSTRFAIEDVLILDGWAMHGGQEFNAA